MNYPIQIADQTFIAAEPDVVADLIHKYNWAKAWPNFILTITEDRKKLGIRWKVAGLIDGTMEVWLQEHLDGVLLHYFIHAHEIQLLSTSSTTHLLQAGLLKSLYAKIRARYRRKPDNSLDQYWRYLNNGLGNRLDNHSIRRCARKITSQIKRQSESGRIVGCPTIKALDRG